MTIKVVQGLINVRALGPEAHSKQPVSASEASQLARNVGLVSTAGNAGVAEAVVANVRGAKNSGAVVEKVRDPQRAEEMVKEVAAKMRGDEESSLGSHDGLSSVSAKDHLMQ